MGLVGAKGHGEEAKKLSFAASSARCLTGEVCLKGYLNEYEYYGALGAYNAGEPNRCPVRSIDAEPLAQTHAAWERRLA